MIIYNRRFNYLGMNRFLNINYNNQLINDSLLNTSTNTLYNPLSKRIN